MQLEALLEKRRWCREVANCRSGGRSEALERLQQEVDRRIDSLAGQELAAMRRIDALGDPGQREVLRLRYLNGWAWKEIARRMSYSQDWVKHLHARALRAMADEGSSRSGDSA
jgi:DNA-directed RNA polymerase specialized sigma24 family protein